MIVIIFIIMLAIVSLFIYIGILLTDFVESLESEHYSNYV